MSLSAAEMSLRLKFFIYFKLSQSDQPKELNLIREYSNHRKIQNVVKLFKLFTKERY